MAKAYLGLGSNIGDKKYYIDSALKFLNENENINVTKVSSYYETEPVGYKEQDCFLNVVAKIETSFSPYDLLEYCNHIEQKLKRKRLIRWGPRTIDIDILLYENFTSDDEKLTIPHPRMTERAFVMIPLYEIAQDLVIEGKSIKEIVENLEGEEINKINL
ncbi:2-amino-4-hydroxy-6-hydroxymethyldihydropteridine diphosphokinase [Thermohalobacter berrensis]|uniref:2-amino-4-hydroxy-6-hydroxymethyldihydropteridine diphosphokinase n=1 Tax=Thermohalobacter berrensis TaxID=99594 RepID=A0A419T6A8_9FIRM|nr:2-amino-4-hydroxy-6-hydroxymethyldihydropteridine diphosphokinase [Thermohalobacter berrensis]RKD32972.1 2-amino-4-hydroxy-6-hydroxymethyldihydropteridine diphosphokinase [Thermohalobacter berrensis]